MDAGLLRLPLEPGSAAGLGAAAAILALLGAVPASAQTAQPPRLGERVPPVEILMSTVNGVARCAPRRMRLPARTRLSFTVINRSPYMMRFAAPDFLRASRVSSAAPRWVAPGTGAFAVRPRSAARLALRTPARGEYHYACSRVGGRPNVASTGFIRVLPPAR